MKMKTSEVKTMDRLEPGAVEQARNTDIVSFLEKHFGFTFTQKHGSYRCDQHPSLAVKGDRRSWYWHSRSTGGFGPIDFQTKIDNMPFREAVQAVGPAAVAPPPIATEQPKPKTLALPDRVGVPLRLYEYLCGKRGIDGVIVDAMIQEGKLYQDKRGNAVFVGFDEHGKPRFASVRGTHDNSELRYDCSGSDKRYGFAMVYSDSDQVRIYESPIDAMSHATIENIIRGDKEAWKRRNRLSLAGVSATAIPKYLEMNPRTKKLVFCLDRDDAGRGASASLSEEYAGKGYYVRDEPPLFKDFNVDLVAMTRHMQRDKEFSTRFKGGISI